MASENTVQKEVWLGLGVISRLFRLNSGRAWLSGLGPKGAAKLTDGSVLLKSARPIALGLATTRGDPVLGQADLCGWTEVEITPEMVGSTVPVFTAIETKRSKGGVVSDNQINFVEQVQKAGGIAGVANSAAAAMQILHNWASQRRAKLKKLG
jgi:hypothetical protein